MIHNEYLTRLDTAIEDVEWARNSGDGTVSSVAVDELQEAASRLLGAVRRAEQDLADQLAR